MSIVLDKQTANKGITRNIFNIFIKFLNEIATGTPRVAGKP